MTPAPWQHQLEDAAAFVRQPALLYGAEPGCGKSRVVVMATERLYAQGAIDALIVVCPASLRSIWADADPVLGEWAKWAQPGGMTPLEYRGQTLPANSRAGLPVVVTSVEYLRVTAGTGRAVTWPHLDPLRAWAATRQTMLVVDESWTVQNPVAKQTRAVYLLARACQRTYLLNGTPGEMQHLFSQYQILDPALLGCANRFQFRGRYCRMGGFQAKQIVGYQREDEFRARTAPYTILRTARESVPLGAEPVRTQIEARLDPSTWRVYRQMRDQMVAWLDTEGRTAAVAAQAGVVAMRLAQIVNGFVGGVETTAEDLLSTRAPEGERPIGREKLDALLAWLADRPLPAKGLIFTRFRSDVERTARVLAEAHPEVEVVRLYGEQQLVERTRAKVLLAPDGDPTPGWVVANTQSGGAGLNFAAAAVCIFLANDYSLKTREQAEKRVDRPGQRGRVTFVDVLATGPRGEKTIDHVIVSALRRKEAMSAWTTDRWRAALEDA